MEWASVKYRQKFSIKIIKLKLFLGQRKTKSMVHK